MASFCWFTNISALQKVFSIKQLAKADNSFFFNSPPNKEVSKFKVKLRASRKIQANRVYEFR